MEKRAISPIRALGGLLAFYAMYASGRRAVHGTKKLYKDRPGGWSDLLGGSLDAVLATVPIAGAGRVLRAAGKLKGLGILRGLGRGINRVGIPVSRVVQRSGDILLAPVAAVTEWKPGRLAKKFAGGFGLSVGGELLGASAEALAGTPPTPGQRGYTLVLPFALKERFGDDNDDD